MIGGVVGGSLLAPRLARSKPGAALRTGEAVFGVGPAAAVDDGVRAIMAEGGAAAEVAGELGLGVVPADARLGSAIDPVWTTAGPALRAEAICAVGVEVASIVRVIGACGVAATRAEGDAEV